MRIKVKKIDRKKRAKDLDRKLFLTLDEADYAITQGKGTVKHLVETQKIKVIKNKELFRGVRISKWALESYLKEFEGFLPIGQKI